MLPWSDWVVPSALGTKVKPHLFTARSTTHECRPSAPWGDEGKAVGCVPPTALLFEEAHFTKKYRAAHHSGPKFQECTADPGTVQ